MREMSIAAAAKLGVADDSINAVEGLEARSPFLLIRDIDVGSESLATQKLIVWGESISADVDVAELLPIGGMEEELEHWKGLIVTLVNIQKKRQKPTKATCDGGL